MLNMNNCAVCVFGVIDLKSMAVLQMGQNYKENHYLRQHLLSVISLALTTKILSFNLDS